MTPRAEWGCEKLRLVYHEAAHACAHVAIGASTVQWVSVVAERGGTFDGKCHYVPKTPTNMNAMLIASLVGPMCDEHFFGRDSHNLETGDWKQAGEFAAQIPGVDMKEALVRGQALARSLVAQYAGAIEQLAAQLLKAQDHLDGEAATRILREAGVHPGCFHQDHFPACYLERRGGRILPTRNRPDALREAAPIFHRIDGGFV